MEGEEDKQEKRLLLLNKQVTNRYDEFFETRVGARQGPIFVTDGVQRQEFKELMNFSAYKSKMVFTPDNKNPNIGSIYFKGDGGMVHGAIAAKLPIYIWEWLGYNRDLRKLFNIGSGYVEYDNRIEQVDFLLERFKWKGHTQFMVCEVVHMNEAKEACEREINDLVELGGVRVAMGIIILDQSLVVLIRKRGEQEINVYTVEEQDQDVKVELQPCELFDEDNEMLDRFKGFKPLVLDLVDLKNELVDLIK